jgi:hypothetical protein
MGILNDMGKNVDKEMERSRMRQQIAIAKLRGNYAQAQQLEKSLYRLTL